MEHQNQSDEIAETKQQVFKSPPQQFEEDQVEISNLVKDATTETQQEEQHNGEFINARDRLLGTINDSALYKAETEQIIEEERNVTGRDNQQGEGDQQGNDQV